MSFDLNVKHGNVGGATVNALSPHKMMTNFLQRQTVKRRQQSPYTVKPRNSCLIRQASARFPSPHFIFLMFKETGGTGPYEFFRERHSISQPYQAAKAPQTIDNAASRSWDLSVAAAGTGPDRRTDAPQQTQMSPARPTASLSLSVVSTEPPGYKESCEQFETDATVRTSPKRK
ncbi:hypothetical protein EAI_13283 [Harpegnathos saltator]|uniref:Uncharacterized protein n=1 Tax=Harpegnathos saltator TaxID=610380 RepID=E2C4X3_HARSA|nr:hypothetical protein EAI_13283 [Harpegnathos saltator]